ncbi:MAG: hypothetical protein AB7Y46_01225 [Armatimonadota bacterium]
MVADASALVSLESARAALRRSVRRLRAWLRVALAARLATLGVVVGAGGTALWVGIERLYGITHPAFDALMPLLTACAAASAVALIWPLPDRLIAVSADRRLGLRDRLATAAELGRAPEPSGMVQAQVADAARHLGLVQPRRAYPLRFDRLTWTMLGCLGALLIAQFAPIPPLLLSAREREDKAALRAIARQVAPVAARLEREAEDAGDEQTQEAARRLRRLAQRMERGELAKREALLELADLEQKLAGAEKALAKPALKTARAAAEQLGQRGREELAQQAERLAREAHRRGEQELKERLRELSEQVRQASTSQELQQAGEELAECAERLGQELPLTALLDAASMAIAREDWEDVAAALEALEECLAGGDRELTEVEAGELAERLEELAQQLTGTDLEKLAECLSKAGQCVRQGDLREAARCLAEAMRSDTEGLGAARLGAAVDQARQAAALAAASLRSPARAAAEEAEGLGVGPDQGTRQGIPPGTPGASLYAPRQTDVPVTLQQTPAQVRPDGEMYTVPARGAPDEVGPSRVPYYEVVGEYSRAAEDALEREEVPPPYRATVRQYFDSLQSGAGQQPNEEQGDD